MSLLFSFPLPAPVAFLPSALHFYSCSSPENFFACFLRFFMLMQFAIINLCNFWCYTYKTFQETIPALISDFWRYFFFLLFLLLIFFIFFRLLLFEIFSILPMHWPFRCVRYSCRERFFTLHRIPPSLISYTWYLYFIPTISTKKTFNHQKESDFSAVTNKMWSTIFVTDEEGRTVVPGTAGTSGIVAPGGPAQGAGGLATLMGGRSTFGGNKRRRTTSTGRAMSEAQEGKVGGFRLGSWRFLKDVN